MINSDLKQPIIIIRMIKWELYKNNFVILLQQLYQSQKDGQMNIQDLSPSGNNKKGHGYCRFMPRVYFAFNQNQIINENKLCFNFPLKFIFMLSPQSRAVEALIQISFEMSPKIQEEIIKPIPRKRIRYSVPKPILQPTLPNIAKVNVLQLYDNMPQTANNRYSLPKIQPRQSSTSNKQRADPLRLLRRQKENLFYL
ncbi:hypothetical protein pb186bvf_014932 [Paramecium bursaria]